MRYCSRSHFVDCLALVLGQWKSPLMTDGPGPDPGLADDPCQRVCGVINPKYLKT